MTVVLYTCKSIIDVIHSVAGTKHNFVLKESDITMDNAIQKSP